MLTPVVKINNARSLRFKIGKMLLLATKLIKWF